jgi:hypothetical protein
MIHYYFILASVISHQEGEYLLKNKLLSHAMHSVGGMPFVDDNSQAGRIVILGKEIFQPSTHSRGRIFLERWLE